ncbi:MAG: hypothetical protein NC211_03825 [Alistipes senegalensis]|nr:hypothetical protein [Oxalobacter formigenes]MCM1280947.1 hypothetical protein [Alistipes senegalensis]
MSKNKARLCPFCGHENVITEAGGAMCNRCFSMGRIDNWNKRTTDKQIENLLAELDKATLDSARLDFVIETNLPLQRSAEGIYVHELGFFATGREAIDAAMQRGKMGKRIAADFDKARE